MRKAHESRPHKSRHRSRQFFLTSGRLCGDSRSRLSSPSEARKRHAPLPWASASELKGAAPAPDEADVPQTPCHPERSMRIRFMNPHAQSKDPCILIRTPTASGSSPRAEGIGKGASSLVAHRCPARKASAVARNQEILCHPDRSRSDSDGAVEGPAYVGTAAPGCPIRAQLGSAGSATE
jgi:hypothetical protein